MGGLSGFIPFAGGSQGSSQGLMGPLSNIIGSNNNFQAAKAPILNTVNWKQLGAADQQSLAALAQMQGLIGQTAGLNGFGRENSVYGQMQRLANQYQNLANGKGPNPALAQLQQATGQNVANQAALMAGVRGGSANAGLLAREAGQQGAATQQQAVGQAATMQAQQQLAALQALQGQQQLLGNTAQAFAGQQMGQTNAYQQAAQNYQANLLNAAGGLNAANVSATNAANAVNAGVAGQNAQTNAQMFGSIMNAAGGAGGMMAMAEGGQVPGYADGGETGPKLDPDKVKQFLQGFGAPQPSPAPTPKAYADGGNVGPSSFVGQYMSNYTPVSANENIAQAPAVTLPTTEAYSSSSGGGKSGGGGGLGSLVGLAALLNKGGAVQNPKLQQSHLNMGGALKAGGHVPGKAAIKGDDTKNDTVDARLSPGEIVIPRSIAQGPNAPQRSAEFVRQVLAKKGKK